MLINKIKRYILDLLATYKSRLPKCNFFQCTLPAVKNKSFCRTHMIYCEYCGLDEVSMEVNGHTVCSDCLISGATRHQPTHNRFNGRIK